MGHMGDASSEFARVPSTLHGQLFLLAFDPKSRRFDGYDTTVFGFALRTAMLTDLLVQGFFDGARRLGRSGAGGQSR